MLRASFTELNVSPAWKIMLVVQMYVAKAKKEQTVAGKQVIIKLQ